MGGGRGTDSDMGLKAPYLKILQGSDVGFARIQRFFYLYTNRRVVYEHLRYPPGGLKVWEGLC